MTEPNLLSPGDVAARLGKSADWWKRRARRKEVPHVRIGRSIAFAVDDVAWPRRFPRMDWTRDTAGAQTRAAATDRYIICGGSGAWWFECADAAGRVLAVGREWCSTAEARAEAGRLPCSASPVQRLEKHLEEA